MSYRYFHIKNLLFLLIIFLLDGCVYDDYPMDSQPEEPGFHFTPDTPVGYMPFVLNFDPEKKSRADNNFDYGYSQEVEIAKGEYHFAVFYTKESELPAYIASLESAIHEDNKDYKANHTIAYARVFGSEIENNEELLKSLSSCIVILNGPYTMEELFNMKKADLTSKIMSEPTITDKDGKKYFTMVSSTYVDNGVVMMESKVDPTKIFDNKITALEKALAGEAAVLAQVERLVAKFNLTFDDSMLTKVGENTYRPTGQSISVFKEIDESTGAPVYDDSYSYEVRITGWGMNALEKKIYLFKKINPLGNYFTDWNDVVNARCYWSEDPDYNSLNYPMQYRKAVDKDQLNYETLESRGENLLKNYSYFDIVNQNNFGKTVYTPENTYNFGLESLQRTLGDRIDFLAGTHLIITAELLTNIEIKSEFRPCDVYRDRTGNFYRNQKDCFISMVIEFNNTLKSQQRMDFKPYLWDQLDTYTDMSTLEMSTQGEFQLCHNGNLMTLDYMNSLNLDSYIIPASVDGGDGKCVLWIDGLSIQKVVDGRVTSTTIGVIDHIETDHEYGNEIHYLRKTPVTQNELKSFLYEWMGALEHFTEGKMYYSIPVEHKPSASVHGVVRNHSYSFSIEGITKPGTAVDIPGQPIIPRIVETRNRIDFKTEILDWHDFETSFTPSGF